MDDRHIDAITGAIKALMDIHGVDTEGMSAFWDDVIASLGESPEAWRGAMALVTLLGPAMNEMSEDNDVPEDARKMANMISNLLVVFAMRPEAMAAVKVHQRLNKRYGN
jgi:hypothetical protein